ncbi:MAG: hypothetical protein QG570_409 [Patescibacteria group bacterium]|nr:hypothetical protein [Patescibacteria group bacterium]
MEEQNQPTKTSSVSDDKLLAAVSYLWILSVVVYLLKKDNAYIAFHAKQGMVLMVIGLVLMIVPIIGWALNLVVFIAVVVGAVKAYTGEKYRLPLIADLADKINF